jgi:trimeric autotransporter adhesin
MFRQGYLLLFCFILNYFAVSFRPLHGQSPESFSYQAVVRDAGGSVLASQGVRFRIGIWQTDPSSGVRVYQETHDHTTDQFGLAHLSIGTGSVIHGVFSNIDWEDGPYFITMELDPAGGSSYQEMGSSQLLSVPYALYAKTAGNVDGSETIITAGTLINVAGTGTIADPYVISSTVDGSETKIIAGDNVTVTGSGTTGSPYQVSASMVESRPCF